MDWNGRIVVITGVSRGLGRAFADECTKRGATVVGCSLEGGNGSRTLDLRDHASVLEFVGSVEKEHGRIDVLINNAGWSPALKPLQDVTEEEFDRCMDTNVKGPFVLIKAAISLLQKSADALIVNVCSRAGSRAHPGLATYSTSKFALRGLTQALARELAEAGALVRCVSVSPGGIDTAMRQELFGKEESGTQQSPETVATLVCDALEQDRIPNGADAFVVRGEITEVVPMDVRR